MNIEEIFKKSSINYDKLIAYGFQKENDRYLFSKNILDNSFRIDIEISDCGMVKEKIYDLSFGEEYTNYKVENQTGEFVNQVREALKNLLVDIKENCATEKYFITDQANRITNFIIKKYHDVPEFAWEKSPGFGIFRNPNNAKWYGLIMNIQKNKIDQGEEEVEILNLKLEEDKIKELLDRKGFYQAYHMNKSNWITILLDDTISDEEIMHYVEESHQFTERKQEWIIPANPKYFDIISHFNGTDTITWKQSNQINAGDFVYLYVGAPYSAILYQCEVIESDIPYQYKDENIKMKKIMKLKLIRKFNRNQYTFEILKKYGVRAVRGPRVMPLKLSYEIHK